MIQTSVYWEWPCFSFFLPVWCLFSEMIPHTMCSLYCLLPHWHSLLILLLHPKDKKSNSNPGVPSFDAVGTLTPHKPFLEQDAIPTTCPQHTPRASVIPWHHTGICDMMRGRPGSHQTWRWRWWKVILSLLRVCVWMTSESTSLPCQLGISLTPRLLFTFLYYVSFLLCWLGIPLYRDVQDSMLPWGPVIHSACH